MQTFIFQIYRILRNLVTIPVENSWSAETLGETITNCSVVIMFNKSTQTFLTHVVGVPHDDFPINDGVGYYIYVTHDSILTMKGLPISSVAVQIHQYWNLIGWFNETPTNAESLGQAINGTTVVIMFNSTPQNFFTHVVGVPSDNFIIKQGMGLFIYTTETSYWHGEG